MQISGVVGEQELGLRQMLRTMGMLDSIYWLSWMLFEVTLACCYEYDTCLAVRVTECLISSSPSVLCQDRQSFSCGD